MTRQSEGRFQCFPRFKSPAVLSCWNYRWSVSIIREKMSANLAEPDNKSVGRSLRDSGCLGHRRRTGEAHTAASETRPIFGAEGKRCSCLGLGAWVPLWPLALRGDFAKDRKAPSSRARLHRGGVASPHSAESRKGGVWKNSVQDTTLLPPIEQRPVLFDQRSVASMDRRPVLFC